VFPVKYELGFYIPEDGILHSRRGEHLKSYTDGGFECRLKHGWMDGWLSGRVHCVFVFVVLCR
jgi:hypothetical protein